jgi:hypothetical protein
MPSAGELKQKKKRRSERDPSDRQDHGQGHASMIVLSRLSSTANRLPASEQLARPLTGVTATLRAVCSGGFRAVE